MDCACLPLLYMDRELVWRSVILFSQSLHSTLLFGGRISPVFTPYFSSASRMTRLDDPESWWRWISFSLPFLVFSGNSWRKALSFSCRAFHVKCSLFPALNLFTSLICCLIFTRCVDVLLPLFTIPFLSNKCDASPNPPINLISSDFKIHPLVSFLAH